MAENQVVLSYGQVAEGHKNDLFGRTLYVVRFLKVKENQVYSRKEVSFSGLFTKN